MPFSVGNRLLLLSVLLLTGCTVPSAGETTPPAVTCEVTYRRSTSESILQSEKMRLTPSEEKRVDFHDLSLKAVYTYSPYEGAALYLDSLAPGTSELLTRTLYQLPHDEPLQDRFAGGHGFTGLSYIHHPESGAEMQYWCGVSQSPQT